MQVKLVGLRSDEGHVEIDALLERTTCIGPDSDDDTERVLSEVFSAKEAVIRARGSHSKVLVVIEPDETEG